MKKTRTVVMLATAVAALFVAASSIEPAAAARDGSGHSSGRVSSGSGSVKSFSSGSTRSYSRSRSSSGGTMRSSRTFRSPSVGSSRTYAYRSHPGRHHHRHFRGRTFVYGYGYPYVYGDYGYSDSCYWLRRRALATGSSYWWNRYYDCIDDY